MSCENCEESAYVIDKLAKLLAEIAVIVNGVEPHDTSWSYHDLPEKVRALKQAPPAAAVPLTPDVLLDMAEPLRPLLHTPEHWRMVREYGGAVAAAALAQQPAAEVPAGYALVPVEPTDGMLREMMRLWTDSDDTSWAAGYRAMLAAAERKGEV